MSMGFEEVLSFWIGPLNAHGQADAAQRERWWKKDSAFDEEIRSRFLETHRSLHAGKHQDWLKDARGTVAYVIVLDQLSRNMFRDTPAMFASDELALSAARAAVKQSMDRELRGDERTFLYMPFMHAEDLAMQEQCVQLFEQFRDGSDEPLRSALDGNLKFAIQHRDIVARFGRFPHRNEILGRPSSAQEREFLTQPGSSF